MSSYRIERLLPYQSEQMFDLAADVERYPEFLRGWLAAHVRQREHGVYYTDQTLGFGPFRARFGTKTVLHRPERIDVTSDQAPFRHFLLSWIFEPQPGGTSRIILAADVTLRSSLLQRAFDLALPGMIADIITSFEKRARQLCRL
jgi:coenzyme Q-binding protein COQ10